MVDCYRYICNPNALVPSQPSCPYLAAMLCLPGGSHPRPLRSLMVYLPLDIPCITHPRAHGRGVRLHLAAVATRLPQRTYRHPRTGSVLHAACRVMPQEPGERHPTGRADGHDAALRRSTSTKGGLSNDSTPAPDGAQLLGRAHALAPETVRECPRLRAGVGGVCTQPYCAPRASDLGGFALHGIPPAWAAPAS